MLAPRRGRGRPPARLLRRGRRPRPRSRATAPSWSRSRSCSTRCRRCSTSARRRAACPGTAAGLWEAARRWCSMPFGELIEPGRALRARGRARHARARLRVHDPRADPDAAIRRRRALYAPEGRMLTAGRRCSASPTSPMRSSGWRPRGPDGCTAARSASASATGCASAAGCCRRRTSPPTRWSSARPVEAAYRGREVLTNPPPSSGGILIAFALDLLERLGDPAPFDDPDALAAARRGDGGGRRARAAPTSTTGCTRRASRASSCRPATSSARRRGSRRGSRAAGARRRAASRSGRRRTSRRSTRTATRPASPARTAPARACMAPGTGVHLNNMLGEEDLNPLGFHRLAPGHPRDEHDGPHDRAARRRDRAVARQRGLEPAALGDPAGGALRRRLRHGRRRGGARGAPPLRGRDAARRAGLQPRVARRAGAPRLPAWCAGRG